MRRFIIVMCLLFAVLSVAAAPKAPKIVAEAFYHNQTSDIEPYIFFTADHDGFYRFTSMMRLYDYGGPGAAAFAAVSVYSGLLCSTTEEEPTCVIFAVYLEEDTQVSLWANAPHYELFSSYDLFVMVEEFKE